MENTIYEYLLGTISESEKKRLFEALEADPGLRARLVELQNDFALADVVSAPGDADTAARGLSELKARAGIKTGTATEPETGRSRMRRVYGWTAKRVAVAAVVLALGAGVAAILNHRGGEDARRLTHITAPTGKRMEVMLSDGTKVWLAPGSSLRYPAKFSGRQRVVELSGEGLFDVATDRRNPFEVRSGEFSVRALGTMFTTSSYRGSFETTLIEGVVEVYERANPEGKITMRPNHRVRLGNGRLECSEVDAEEALGLQKGIYNFHDVTFGEIMARLEVWYGVEIAILDDTIAGRLFSAKFRESDDIETILKALQRTSWFEFARTSGAGDGTPGTITIK